MMTAYPHAFAGLTAVELSYLDDNFNFIPFAGPVTAVASATTTDIGSVGTTQVGVTGTATIMSFGSGASSENPPAYFVTFAGGLTLIHNATSLILPGGANIATAAGDALIAQYLGTGYWRVLAYFCANGRILSDQAITSVASATTVDLGASIAKVASVTGNSTISSFGATAPVGWTYDVVFPEGSELVYNSSSMILPDAANLTITANSGVRAISLGSGNWQILPYGGGGGSSGTPNLSNLMDTQFGSTWGDILFRGATGWQTLAPGVAGAVLSGGTVVTDVAAGDGVSVLTSAGTATVTNTGVLALVAGTNTSLSAGTGTVTISATGGSSVVAGTGISITTATGTATVTNTGIVSLVAGTGMSVTTATGTATVTSTGAGIFTTVKQYGAVGNGTTDDTAAIQLALSSGATDVYFPGGTYLVSSVLYIPSNIRLYGDGTGSSIKVSASFAASGTALPSGVGDSIFINSNYLSGTNTGISISGMQIDATAYGINGHLLVFYNCTNVHVDKCTFLYGQGGTAFVRCSSYTVTDCYCFAPANCAYDNWDGCHDGVISGNYVNGNSISTSYGILLTGVDTALTQTRTTYNMLVEGNNITGTNVGIWIQAGNNSTSASIDNNCRVIGNTVRGCVYGINASYGTNNIISNNTLVSCGTSGAGGPIGINAEYSNLGQTGMVIANNVIESVGNPNAAAISVGSASSLCNIIGNIITGGNYTYGILLGSLTTKCLVTNNVVFAGTAGSYSNSGTNNTVIDPSNGSGVLSLTAGPGLSVSAASGAVTIYNTDYISVKNYGAKGDGSTDDTAAIQAAFTYAQTVNMPVRIPAGVYIVSGPLTLTLSNSTGGINGLGVRAGVFGDGAQSTLLRYTGTSTSPVLTITGSADFLDVQTIKGFRINRNDGTQSGTGLQIVQAQAALIEDVTAVGFTNGLWLYNVNTIKVLKSAFNINTIGVYCTYPTGGTAPNAIEFDTCFFANNMTNAVNIAQGAGIYMHSCVFEYNGTSTSTSDTVFISYNGGAGTVAGNFLNNYFEGSTGTADIYIQLQAPMTQGNASFIGNIFAKLNNTQYVTSHIFIDASALSSSSAYGPFNIQATGNGFFASSGYTPVAARYAISAASGGSGYASYVVNNVWLENTYTSMSLEGPGITSPYTMSGASLVAGSNVTLTTSSGLTTVAASTSGAAGAGTVSTASANALAFYSSSGTTVSGNSSASLTSGGVLTVASAVIPSFTTSGTASFTATSGANIIAQSYIQAAYFEVGYPYPIGVFAQGGSPNGTVTAGTGALVLDTSGTTGRTLWTKETSSGSSGWVGVLTTDTGVASIVAGTNVTVSAGTGTVTISAPSASGITSVAAGTGMSVTTTSGTATVSTALTSAIVTTALGYTPFSSAGGTVAGPMTVTGGYAIGTTANSGSLSGAVAVAYSSTYGALLTSLSGDFTVSTPGTYVNFANAGASTGTITPTSYFRMKLGGTIYKIPCVAD